MGSDSVARAEIARRFDMSRETVTKWWSRLPGAPPEWVAR